MEGEHDMADLAIYCHHCDLEMESLGNGLFRCHHYDGSIMVIEGDHYRCTTCETNVSAHKVLHVPGGMSVPSFIEEVRNFGEKHTTPPLVILDQI